MPANILLLTATITPPIGAAQLARMDPELRRADYFTALKFYLGLIGKGIDKIVFVENSATDISDFAEYASDQKLADKTEFLSFAGLDYPPAYGRAFGEFGIIIHAVEHSQTSMNADSHTYYWKVTGRYIVKNLLDLVMNQPPEFDFYCNFRNYPKNWIDMYLMAFNRRGYDEVIRPARPHLREDGVCSSAEELFRKFYDQLEKRIRVTPRFQIIPIIEGIRGLDNKNYTNGADRLKSFARKIALKYAPWLWI